MNECSGHSDHVLLLLDSRSRLRCGRRTYEYSRSVSLAREGGSGSFLFINIHVLCLTCASYRCGWASCTYIGRWGVGVFAKPLEAKATRLPTVGGLEVCKVLYFMFSSTLAWRMGWMDWMDGWINGTRVREIDALSDDD